MAIAFPAAENCSLVVIDVQERLCPAMHSFAAAQETMTRALRIASVFSVDVFVTEQYPKGLGATIPELADAFPSQTQVFEKTAFSCWGAPAFAAAVEAIRPEALVLIGMETHVCVQQTALQAVQRGYRTILLADAVCSRRPSDRDTALAFMTAHGVEVTTLEAVAFDWLGNAKHPLFRDVSRLVK